MVGHMIILVMTCSVLDSALIIFFCDIIVVVVVVAVGFYGDDGGCVGDITGGNIFGIEFLIQIILKDIILNQ